MLLISYKTEFKVAALIKSLFSVISLSEQMRPVSNVDAEKCCGSVTLLSISKLMREKSNVCLELVSVINHPCIYQG